MQTRSKQVLIHSFNSASRPTKFISSSALLVIRCTINGHGVRLVSFSMRTLASLLPLGPRRLTHFDTTCSHIALLFSSHTDSRPQRGSTDTHRYLSREMAADRNAKRPEFATVEQFELSFQLPESCFCYRPGYGDGCDHVCAVVGTH